MANLQHVEHLIIALKPGATLGQSPDLMKVKQVTFVFLLLRLYGLILFPIQIYVVAKLTHK